MTLPKDRTADHTAAGTEATTTRFAIAFARLPRKQIVKARPAPERSLPAVGSFS